MFVFVAPLAWLLAAFTNKLEERKRVKREKLVEKAGLELAKCTVIQTCEKLNVDPLTAEIIVYLQWRQYSEESIKGVDEIVRKHKFAQKLNSILDDPNS